jgi:hypothetical protein
MTKGEIYFGKNTRHPIVFLKEENSEQFIGCIITKSKTETYQNNIPMIREHFEETDEKGNKFQTQFINSYFVNLQLIKKDDWGPFTLTGKLTEKGVLFIESHFKKDDPTLWNDYLNK